MLKNELRLYLSHLDDVYAALNGDDLEIVICGGAGLNLLGLIARTTKDIDLVSPETWPDLFKKATQITKDYFALPEEWINAGPVDLLRLGLPNGFFNRCVSLPTHSKLKILLTSRIDQVFFKLYASLDSGGYHVQDLKALKPTEDELFAAAKWTFTHDISKPFYFITIDFLIKMGWSDVAKKLAK